jgi:hypothetical protein
MLILKSTQIISIRDMNRKARPIITLLRRQRRLHRIRNTKLQSGKYQKSKLVGTLKTWNARQKQT